MRDLLRVLCDIIEKGHRYGLMLIKRSLFGSYGRRFRFDPKGNYCYKNIHVGNCVNLGLGPRLLAARSKILIGDNVMFGPEVIIVAGIHNTRVIGVPMTDVTVKEEGDDVDVIVEDDVWIGARATILRGVTIGRGSIVGAGAVVTKSVPSYSIVAGNPASVMRFRWTVEQILEHEALLYKSENRLTQEALQRLQSDSSMLPTRRN